MSKLIIYEDSDESNIDEFALTLQRLSIGSGPDNELVLEADDVDLTHASLELRHGQWTLQDLGAPGGTFVNGIEIAGPYQLKHNDVMEMGPVKLRFHEFDVDEAADFADNDPTPILLAAPDADEVVVSGRAWFMAVTGITLAIVFIILLLVVVLTYFDIINLADMLTSSLNLHTPPAPVGMSGLLR